MPPKPLRVLMISTDRNIFREGSEVRERMKEYAALTEELHIIVFTLKKDGCVETEIASNARAYPTDSWTRWRYITGAYFLAKRLFFARPHDTQITLITPQDPFEAGLAGWLISRHLPAPLQYQIHTDFLSPNFRRGNFLNKIRVMIAKFLLTQKADIRVVSKRIHDSILQKMKFGRNKSPRITVLPVFVDQEKFRQSPVTVDLKKELPQFSPIILVVSRLESEKNVLLALRLFKEVCQKGQEVSPALVIVGDGSQKTMLQKYAASSGIGGSAFFMGWRDDLASFYKTADLLLVTSDYEGYGRMFAEAQAAGCPVLTYDIGAAKEILHTWNSIMCEEGDEVCLFTNLHRLVVNPQAVENFKSPARDGARRLLFETKEAYLVKMKKLWTDAAVSRDIEFFA